MREAMKNDVPQIWKDRAKAGLCPVCGKEKLQFNKGMIVYCSPECRDEYAKKYTSWSDLRQKIMKRDGMTCQVCGINPDKSYEKRNQERDKWILEWLKKPENKEHIESVRAKRLVDMSERYEESWKKIMDDVHLAEGETAYDRDRPSTLWGVSLEVDHKVALVNGGDMWEESNLQTLCSDCHKKKTKEDVKKSVFKTPQNKGEA